MNLTKRLSFAEAQEFVAKNKAACKLYYITKDLTAAVVAEKLNVHYDANFQKALFNAFGPKGKGIGGARQGAGNKKGIEFCTRCGKSKKNCECDS